MCNCIHCRREQEAMEVRFAKGYETAKIQVNSLVENPHMRKEISDVCVCPPEQGEIFNQGYRIGLKNSDIELGLYSFLKKMEDTSAEMWEREKKRMDDMYEKIRLEQEKEEKERTKKIFKEIFNKE